MNLPSILKFNHKSIWLFKLVGYSSCILTSLEFIVMGNQPVIEKIQMHLHYVYLIPAVHEA